MKGDQGWREMDGDFSTQVVVNGDNSKKNVSILLVVLKPEYRDSFYVFTFSDFPNIQKFLQKMGIE